MLVTLSQILKDARAKKYGVGLFNMLNLEMMRGIIEAAEEEKSPVILGVAEVHLPIIPFNWAIHNMVKAAKEARVPVCLHFDHGTDYAKILEAMRGGCSSVMYDGSALPYEENIANTAEIVKVAKALGISVEAELGHVGGNEDGSDDGMEDDYTNVAQVVDFVSRTGVDALAVAIGTAHGQYKKPPKLDLNRLAEINKVSKVPLVLHGGSGLSDDDFKKSIREGISKVNICTDMLLAAQKAVTTTGSVDYSVSIVAAKESVKKTVIEKMRLFGSSGKA